MADETKSYDLAFSPIPVTVTGTFGTNAKYRRIIVTATVGSSDFEFSIDGDDGAVTIDVSSVLRGALINGFNLALASAVPTATCSLSARTEYMSAAGIITTGKADVTPDSVSATIGRKSALERSGVMSGISKPAASQPIKFDEKPVVNKYADKPDFYVDKFGAKYVYFKFLTNKGEIDYAYARTLYSESMSTESETYSRIDQADYSLVASLVTTPSRSYRSYEMSSGDVSADWARWWAGVFLQSMFFCIRINEKWVPCVIKPKSNSTKIVDWSKAEACHVDFTVTLAYDG